MSPLLCFIFKGVGLELKGSRRMNLKGTNKKQYQNLMKNKHLTIVYWALGSYCYPPVTSNGRGYSNWLFLSVRPLPFFWLINNKSWICIRFLPKLFCGFIITIFRMSSNLKTFREYLSRLLAPDWSKFIKYVNCSKIFSL